jgi:hypothetical protein
MTSPVRWRDDESVPPARREALRNAPSSRPIPNDARARSRARINRLLVVPAAAGLLLWIKCVAAAGLCALGVVAAAHAVPAFARWIVAPSGSAPTLSKPHSAAQSGEGAIPAQVASSALEPAIFPSRPAVEREPTPKVVQVGQPTPVRSQAARAGVEPTREEPGSGDSLAREAAMLEEARRSLDRNPSAALALVDRHAAMFPGGSLGIERELLGVEALRRLGRFSDARARGMILLEQARGSIYEERVKNLILRATAAP